MSQQKQPAVKYIATDAAIQRIVSGARRAGDKKTLLALICAGPQLRESVGTILMRNSRFEEVVVKTKENR